MTDSPRILTLPSNARYLLTNYNVLYRPEKIIPVPEISSQRIGLSFYSTAFETIHVTNICHDPVLRVKYDLGIKKNLSLSAFERENELTIAPKDSLTFFVPHVPENSSTPIFLSIYMENLYDKILVKIENLLPAQ